MPPGERRGRVGPIRFRTFLRNTVLDVMRSRGWLETDSDLGWDFFWADVGWIREVYDHVRLDDTQRINHFRNHFELTRKDLMVKNLKRMRKTLEREGRVEEAVEFDFFPATFSLPQDYGLFEMEFRRQPNAIWIMKPPAKAQGKGIFLFSKISQIAEWRKDYKQRQGGAVGDKSGSNLYGSEQVEPYLAQRYIDNPHLVGGKKYDLRVYVLVTGYSPLVVWLHRTGFARFCHQRFSLKDIENTFIHVTNVAVQKTNPKYTPSSGCKYGLRNLRQYITASRGVEAAQKLFDDIQNMILRSLHAVQKIIVQDKHSFELYGYDIMIDNDLHPWLIETNASPSLSAETPADYHLKFNVLEDMFNVVDLEKRRTGEEVRVGGFDLIWKNGPVGPSRRSDVKGGCGSAQSFLGCANEFEIPITHMRMPPRLQQLDSSERLLT
ncbi:putative tubulin tyrosine ligase protein [Trypanosoma theileri]|uniref:Tubulin--tyrosine ligase-like protein 9 n=1 Tax=Trypanosoma theileri TaxID=67003 RepID=A0A1X0P705_9TRYP|nr:putative tubulin tyrosine ligase protein [Trypanosoma theileri]ORC92625.1 putative tubulin tyrosine ligase protein [Trypanosoma theileri]